MNANFYDYSDYSDPVVEKTITKDNKYVQGNLGLAFFEMFDAKTKLLKSKKRPVSGIRGEENSENEDKPDEEGLTLRGLVDKINLSKTDN